jgi:hypothetical protein
MTNFLSLFAAQAVSLRAGRKITVCVTNGPTEVVADHTCAGCDVDTLNPNSGRTLPRRNRLNGLFDAAL